jgi:replicative DNA helicase
MYAKLLSESGEKRRVRDAGRRIEFCNTYAEAQALLADVRPTQTHRLKTAVDALREMNDAMQVRFNAEGVVTGVPTGLHSLDMLTGGWQAGDLVAIGGATSSGKTAFALQASIAAGRCLYVSLEMMAAQLYERVVANVGAINYRWLRFPREAPSGFIETEYVRAVRLAQAVPLLVDDQPGLTGEQICARIRQQHMVEPLRLAVIDHLNLVRRPRKNDNAELGELAISFKNLAKELRIPVLLLVQLNRGAGKERPELSAFRNSGEIEEALDTAVMVHRDEYHNPNGPLKGYAELIVRKQRQGERNVTAWAKSYLAQMRFESCDEPSGASTTAGRSGGFASIASSASEPVEVPMARGGFGRAA